MTQGNNNNNKKYRYVVGIDLGTTNSCLSVVKDSNLGPEVIANAEGNRTTPSVVHWSEDGTTSVGQKAVNLMAKEPARTFFSVKRLIGASSLPAGCNKLPYKTSVENGRVVIKLPGGKTIQPEEVSAKVLSFLAERAAQYLDTSVQKIGFVITVPAYFNNEQRTATKNAATIAGLDVLRIINEPTAAALNFGYKPSNQDTQQTTASESEYVAVFDLGGGTFDVSILDIDTQHKQFEVKATNGDSFLGGDDFTREIETMVLDDFQKKYSKDLKQDPIAMARVRAECEKAKHRLSYEHSTKIDVQYVTSIRKADNSFEPAHIDTTITRATFEKNIQHLLNRLKQPCLAAIKDADLNISDIKKVLLVGGSTRIPAVQEIAEAIFKQKPSHSVNPDEAVACGAAIQGGVLAGSINDVLLLDVTPLSLGIETQGGLMTKIVEKNTTIPAKKSQVFTTAADNQSAVTISVYQGEREIASANKSLGQFNLEGIEPARRGEPQIEVTFDIDADGVLNVSAIDKKTNKKQSITITNSGGLSEDEIAKMTKDAEENRQKDQDKKDLINLQNQSESTIYRAQNAIKDRKDLDDAIVTEVNTAIQNLQSSIGSANKDEINEKLNALNEAINKIPSSQNQESTQDSTDNTSKKENNDQTSDNK